MEISRTKEFLCCLLLLFDHFYSASNGTQGLTHAKLALYY